MSISFFGKYFKYAFVGLLIAELISLLVYITPQLHQAVFFILLIITAVLTIKKVDYGIYLILAELFIGGKGHLFAISINNIDISIRIGLFITVILIWICKTKFKIRNLKLETKSYYFLFAFILIGLINGYLNNDIKNLFFDFNAWIFFGLAFIFLNRINTSEQIKNIIQILGGATTYLSLKTVGTLFLFSHYFTGIGGFFYKWIRDTGVGEITYVSGSIFRIFFQSQLYVMVGFLLSLMIILGIKKIRTKESVYLFGYAYLTSLAIVVSQSRSYWVGLGATFVVFIILGWWQFNLKIKKTTLVILTLILMVASQLLFINLITGNFQGNIVGERFKNLQSESAGISRLNQLKPLSSEITKRPLLGHGFGKTVTYQSNDPRILAQNPDGIYTTFAFEWGYLDIALKLGLLGLLAYLALIGQIMYLGIRKLKSPDLNFKAIQAGLLLGFIAILVTNIFSPYLNHPLGIGYIILISSIYNQKQ